MATKKRKARGGELWAVIDTTNGEIVHLCGAARVAVDRRDADGMAVPWDAARVEVRKILWRFAPRGKRGN